MNHNYKLTDFKIMQGETDKDILERFVSVDLRNVRELPEIIVDKLETMINNLIADYEKEKNVVIPLDNMEIDMQLEVDTLEKELSIHAFVSFGIAKDSLYSTEIISSDDKDYDAIKKYFLAELNYSVLERIKDIANCV